MEHFKVGELVTVKSRPKPESPMTITDIDYEVFVPHAICQWTDDMTGETRGQVFWLSALTHL